MPIPINPPVLESPIGTSADVFAIPSQTDSGSGALSYRDGWPAITGISLKAGGLAPQREYFNAVNKLLSQHTFFQQSGGVYPWNPALDYIAGAHVLGSNGLEYVAVAPSGPDVSGTGAKDPTASGNSSYWLLLAARIMSAQGGLVVNPSTGQASVDFSQMPDSVLQKLLQQIKVPYWLEKNTNFYVNGETGSDTLDEGRGESKGKPFKTLQACINYVTDNYNVSRYIAYINLAPGNYKGPFDLPNFSYTTGGITIQSLSSERAVITYDGIGTEIVGISNGNWTLNNIDINATIHDNVGRNANTTYIIGCSNGHCTLKNVNIDASYVDSDITTNSCEIVILRCYGGTITVHSLAAMCSRSNEKARITILGASDSGLISLPDRNVAPGFTLALSGVASYAVSSFALGRVACTLNSSAYPFTIIDNGVSIATKYVCSAGGTINTAGKGPDFFPGTSPGILEESTYCWYR